ncbi:MAG: HAMP domain-containing protein [Anaerolineae bacterium]
MKIRSSITRKLTLVFVLFALLLLVSMSALFYVYGRAALEAATISELRATAIEKEAALDAWITERKSDAVALAQSPGLREDLQMLLTAPTGSPAHALAEDKIRQELQMRIGPDQAFTEVFILEPAHAQILLSTNRTEEGKFREDLPYFIEGRRAPYIQNIYYSFTLQGAAMTASAPVRAANGELLGVLAARLNLGEMNAVINRRTGLRATDDFFLVTSANLFATQPRFISDPAVLQRGVYTEPVKRCLTRTNGTLAADNYRGEPVLSVYRWLDGAQLCLITELDQAEAFAPVRDLTVMLLGVALAMIGAASVISLLVARTITRPVEQLVNAAHEIGAGKLDTRIEMKSGDEIGQLAETFVQMAENLQKILVSRDDLLREVAERQRAEGTLRALSSRQEAILAAIPDIIMEVDNNKVYAWANEPGIEFFGADVIGREAALYFEGEQDTYGAEKPLFTGSENTIYVESWQRRKDGQKRLLAWWRRVLKDESGNVTGALSSARDITERRLAEVQLNAQLDELRRWHQATLGREIRILDLKREVNELLAHTDNPPRYLSAEITEHPSGMENQ